MTIVKTTYHSIRRATLSRARFVKRGITRGGAALLMLGLGAALVAPPAHAEGSLDTAQSPTLSALMRLWQPNTLYAYVGSGESLDFKFGDVVGSPFTVKIYDPSGTLQQTCTVAAGPMNCLPSPPLPSIAGAWKFDITGSGASGLGWKIRVNDANNQPVTGRVWSDDFGLTNSGNPFPPQTFSLWYVGELGYRYKVDYPGFNGFNSRFISNRFGLTPTGAPLSCVPAYSSQSVTASYAVNPACGSLYHIFFEAPDTTNLPATYTPPGVGQLPKFLMPTIVSGPKVSNVTFTPTVPGTQSYDGTLSFDIADHIGQAMLLIDADGDGNYNGSKDLQIPYPITSPGHYTYNFNGKDALNNPIPDGTIVTAKVQITRAGEIHLNEGDVENNPGGIVATALNGPAAGTADADLLYWDDANITVPPKCSSTPTSNGLTGIHSTPVPPSTNGVHGWGLCQGGSSNPGGPGGTWGNNVNIDSWTYAKVDVSGQVSWSKGLNVTLAKSTAMITVTPNLTIPYTITVTNKGAAPVSNYAFDDVVPANTTFVSATGAGVSVIGCSAVAPTNAAGTMCTITIAGPIAANGGTASVNFTVKVNPTIPPGTTAIGNQAYYKAPPPVCTMPTCNPNPPTGCTTTNGVTTCTPPPSSCTAGDPACVSTPVPSTSTAAVPVGDGVRWLLLLMLGWLGAWAARRQRR